MKKTIILGSLFLLLVACELDKSSISLPPELYQCSNYMEIRGWIINNITYKKDIDQYGGGDYHAAPERTLETREGDCEDFSILMGYLCEVLLDKDIIIVIAASKDKRGGHSFNKIDGVYIEPQGGDFDNKYLSDDYYRVEYYFSFYYPLIKNNRG